MPAHLARVQVVQQVQQSRAARIVFGFLPSQCTDTLGEFLDLIEIGIGLLLQSGEVGVCLQHRVVLVLKPCHGGLGRIGVDLAPVLVLAVQLGPPHHLRAQFLTLGVHLADELLGVTNGLLRLDHIIGERGALVACVALVDVLGRTQLAPVILDRAPVAVLAQALIGDRPAMLAELVGCINQHVIAHTRHQIHGSTGAFVIGVGQAQTVGESARLGAPRRAGRDHPLHLEVTAHGVLVDVSQYLPVVLVGHQQAQTGRPQHLLHRPAPPFLARPQIHQFADVGQLLGGKTQRRRDFPTHAVLVRRHRGSDMFNALELGGSSPQLIARRRQRAGRHHIGVMARFEFRIDPGDCAQALDPHGFEFLSGLDVLVVAEVPQGTVVGGTAARHLLGPGPGMSELTLERCEITVGGGDPAEQLVPFASENVLARLDFVAFTAEPGDLGVQQIDLRAGQRQPLLVNVVADGVVIHHVDGGQLCRIAGVRLLNLFDIAQCLALTLRDRQRGARVHQRGDLPQRLGNRGHGLGLVEHVLTHELFQATNAFERLGLTQKLLSSRGTLDTNGGVELFQIPAFALVPTPARAVEDRSRISLTRPGIAQVTDVGVGVNQVVAA